MLDDIYEHVVINDPFLLLEAVHPALLTDVVDHAGILDVTLNITSSALPEMSLSQPEYKRCELAYCSVIAQSRCGSTRLISILCFIAA